MSRFFLLFSLSLAGLLSTSCGRVDNTAVAKVAREEQPTVPLDRWADDVGRYLGGMPAKPGSKLEAVHQDPLFKAHAVGFDDSWANFEKSRQPAMQRFQQSELADKIFADSTLYYPFGGPDTLTATTFFPNNKHYLLMGLEPPGDVPSEDELRQKPLGSYLPQIRGTLNTLLSKSFFITQFMAVQVRGQITDGLLPLMLVQLVRTNHTVLGTLQVTVDSEGNLVERQEGIKGIAGVLVEFQRNGSTEKKRLVYLSGNLSNIPLEKNQPLLKFLNKQKPMVTYFKAASYLCHSPNFTLIRDKILSLSSAILQDDSGIPFKHYDPKIWDVQLYGNFDHPYGSFQNKRQPDLKTAYEGPGVKPLDFPIGYGFSRIQAGLQLARKK